MEHAYILVNSEYIRGAAARTSYGIALIEENDGAAHILQTIPNISSDRTQVEKLVAYCNTLQLHPVHLFDVVDDFLASL